jgi:quinol monooxygenase YgiN
MSENLIVIAYLTAKPGKEADARKNIRSLVAPTLAEKGCIIYDLHEMHGESTKFVFYEVWHSAEDLDTHAKSEHLKAFQKIAPEFLVGPAEITKWKKVD